MGKVTSTSPRLGPHRRPSLVGNWLRGLGTPRPLSRPAGDPTTDSSRTTLGRQSLPGSAVTDPGLVARDRAPGPVPRTHAIAMPGRCLGPYRLVERIGRGRQADVWRAQRLEAPGDEVAIKLLPGTIAARDPRRLAQLRREAERGQRLTSPSLLPTYDFGEVDGLVYLAMPLIEGCPLAHVLQQRRARNRGETLPERAHALASVEPTAYIRAIVYLLAKVARAVAVAHEARVVHRDIKPMNILVGRRAVGTASVDAGVYLCDFGLARDLDFATPNQLRDGAGSPLYMAPERLLKRPADEVRCDVYALGVTLFESLALVPPFEVPPDLPPVHWAEFLASATTPDLTDLAPDVPPGLRRVVQRAMSREPNRRHATALRLAHELERTLDGERVDSARMGARLVARRDAG